MVFNLLCAPCFAAIGAIKREMNNAKWTWITIGYMTGWAYVMAFIAYNVGGLFSGDVAFGAGSVIGFALIALIIYLIVRKGYVPEEGHHTITSVDAANA